MSASVSVMTVKSLICDNYSWIQRTAHTFCKTRQDAEDLAGETILKCLKASDGYNTHRPFKPWVSVIMKNTFISQYNRRQSVQLSDYEDCEKPSGIRTDSLAILNSLLSVIEDFGSKYRSIQTMMLYVNGYSYDEIADMESIPLGTVSGRLRTARGILRKALMSVSPPTRHSSASTPIDKHTEVPELRTSSG